MRPTTSNLMKANTPNYSIPSKDLCSWLTFFNYPSNFTCENMILSLGLPPRLCRKYSPKRNDMNNCPDNIIDLGYKIDCWTLHAFFV